MEKENLEVKIKEKNFIYKEEEINYYKLKYEKYKTKYNVILNENKNINKLKNEWKKKHKWCFFLLIFYIYRFIKLNWNINKKF